MGEAIINASDRDSDRDRNSEHRWKFFRAGGFDQVCLETGADLTSLGRLDQKLWTALSCPVTGMEFDEKTLKLIDGDGDGRIRVPEIIAAVEWAASLLKNADDLLKGSPELPLAAIAEKTPDGGKLLSAARHILTNLGKEDAAVITVTDTTDTEKIFAQTRFNGDGIVPADAADDPGVHQVISDIINCLGEEIDRSGKPGVSQEKVDRFYADLQAFADWRQEATAMEATTMGTTATGTAGVNDVCPLGEDTDAAFRAFNAVRAKVEDYFARCRLAAFDDRALGALNRQETEYIAIADKDLTAAVEDATSFPLAMIAAGRPLPLRDGVNPAWSAALADFTAAAVAPLLGERDSLTETEWQGLQTVFAAYEEWLGRKGGAAVEKLGIERVREIIAGGAKGAIDELIAKDKALAPEFAAITDLDRLIRYHRDLFTLLKNFVSFADFYTRKDKALFQAGTLYLDGRSCELCIRVNDMGKHAALATLSRTYLAYCRCTRNAVAGKGGTDEITIAAAFTDGDADYLMTGRNGVFYDRQGRDWDATIVKVIEHPISIRQAFWSPYKRIGRMINEQIEKMAATRDKAATDKAAVGVAGGARKIEAGTAATPAKPPFDVAKFAGIFAAIGLAVGAIGTALAAVITGFMKLIWWQMPLAIAGIMLLISGPAMVIAWLKLRQRTLGPLLDANGWAVNTRAKINIAFGRSLTKVATLPTGAERSLEDDPFADKKNAWPKVLAIIAIIAALLYFFGVKCPLLK